MADKKKEKDPAFLFYSADFMVGTLLMTMEERGQYITLLAVMHQQGRLTLDEVEAVVKKKPSPKLSAKFKMDENGLWYNERLEQEIAKRKKFTDSRANSLDINNNDMVNIYLLHDPMSNYFKIGSSKYPMLRLQDMQKKNASIVMFWCSPVLVKRSVEKDLHTEFKEKKIKNDWFGLTSMDLDNIINKQQFRTEALSESRTVFRTVNDNENDNENGYEVIGLKKESFISIRKVLANDKAKLIYDLPLYFSMRGQLEGFKRAGWDKFDEFMAANPRNIFKDESHLYNSFRKFCLDGQLKTAIGKKNKISLEELKSE